MAQLKPNQMSQLVGWNTFTHSHMSVLRLFLLYALPLSVVPPVMIYYAGVSYGVHLLSSLSTTQLEVIGIVFFLAELAMTFLFASVIQRLAEWVDVKPAFEDCYKLTVVVATPLWLAPLFLYIPSVILNLATGAAALMLSGMLIFYSVPSIIRVEEKGHAILLSGSILAVGLVVWAAMMYLTLLTWGFAAFSLTSLI